MTPDPWDIAFRRRRRLRLVQPDPAERFTFDPWGKDAEPTDEPTTDAAEGYRPSAPWARPDRRCPGCDEPRGWCRCERRR